LKTALHIIAVDRLNAHRLLVMYFRRLYCMVKIDDWIFSWTCPYCRQIASIKGDNLSKNTHKFRVNNLHMGLYTCVIFCPNSKCGEFTMDATLYSINAASVVEVDNPLMHWNLKPQSSAIPFPIPFISATLPLL